MNVDLIGWDIGGAHLKAAAKAEGQIVCVIQKPCPLWLGLCHLHYAITSILDQLKPAPGCRHAVTMTGELADLFANREEGVFGLLRALCEHVPIENVFVFAGPRGFLAASQVKAKDTLAIASANWFAAGLHAASRVGQGLLIDIGSTTTDLLALRHGAVLTRGCNDYERLRHGELVYCGVVRTSLMSLARSVPFEGEWIGLMAEHFATTADVYRLTGELLEHVDQSPAADDGEKTSTASARRIARMLGRDIESPLGPVWKRLSAYFRERQLDILMQACMRQLSRGLLDDNAPIIGAGVGRFLVQELANRIGQPYLDLADLYPMAFNPSEFHLADCAPALAVACLARETNA